MGNAAEKALNSNKSGTTGGANGTSQSLVGIWRSNGGPIPEQRPGYKFEFVVSSFTIP